MNRSLLPRRFQHRWSSWWRNDVAMALGGDMLWLARPGDNAPVGMPAYVAVATADGRILAIGAEAKAMQGSDPGRTAVVRLTDPVALREDPDLFTEAVRALWRTEGGRGVLPPRVVCVAEAGVRREVRSAVLNAGAREVLLLEPPMAAAIGAGLAVEAADPRGVLVLDRFTCSCAVIARAGVVAGFSAAQGVGRLLDDIAVHALATQARALDVEELDVAIRHRGIAGSEAIGWEAWLDEVSGRRGSMAAATEPDVRRVSQPFQHWLAWQFQRAFDALPPGRRRDVETAPVLLTGPYAEAAGVRDLVATAVHRPVTVPERATECAIRGAQHVLADIGFLIRYATAARARR